ncbi:tyrosine-type recombinase/integrase [Leeuwenhoekiella sp. MAR_2009_132]|uniref:tyrosine-type recombinase/integrase n=1 Tax=Leeuwenhoekiella sp. MAR_2009_132 TaxID=1392489 RepID=UPI000689B836|nr:tyrosine-type recombinase/integrase [Leeuwenhoekiella sp. MAR_2009_132]
MRDFDFFVDYSAFNISKPIPKDIVKTKRQNLSKDHVEPINIPILKKYVTYLRGKRFSESTLRTYYSFVLGFAIYLSKKSLADAQLDDLSLYIRSCVKNYNYSVSTHRQMTSAFKHLIHFTPKLSIEDLALQQPKKSKKLPEVLSAQEILDLLRATRNLKHRALLALIYSCGLRIGELLNLELRDLDIDRNQLHIRQGKGRKDRYVGMAESFKPLLYNYLTSYTPKRYFVEGVHGEKYSPESIRAFLKRSCKLAKITKHVTPHTLRHSYATHLLENGVDIRYIQELLGHSRTETTMIYTHVGKKDLQSIASPLDLVVKRLSETAKSNENILLSRNLH